MITRAKTISLLTREQGGTNVEESAREAEKKRADRMRGGEKEREREGEGEPGVSRCTVYRGINRLPIPWRRLDAGL